MKTLVVVTHPDIENSIINKRWIEELSKYPDRFVVHQLHKVYPDEKIDVDAEQKLIEQYDKVVFQCPVCWFSSTALLKKWLAEVLINRWASGSKSDYKGAGRRHARAMSGGMDDPE